MTNKYLLVKLDPDAQLDKEFIKMIESVDDGKHKVIQIESSPEDTEDPIIYWK